MLTVPPGPRRGALEVAIIDTGLQSVRFFKKLPPLLRREMAAVLVAETAGTGDVLYRRGVDAGDCFYVVTSGMLALHDGEGADVVR